MCTAAYFVTDAQRAVDGEGDSAYITEAFTVDII